MFLAPFLWYILAVLVTRPVRKFPYVSSGHIKLVCDLICPSATSAVMGPNAFTNYLTSTQGYIGTLIDTVDSVEKRVTTLTRRVKAGGDDAWRSAGELAET